MLERLFTTESIYFSFAGILLLVFMFLLRGVRNARRVSQQVANLTAIKKTEIISKNCNECQEIEERLQFAQFTLENSKDSVFWVDSEGKFFYVNEAACQGLGYSFEELLTLNVWDIDRGFTPETWLNYWQEMKPKNSFIIESQHQTKYGRIFPVEVQVNCLQFKGKDYSCTFVRDISNRKHTEQALKESEEKFRSIFEQAAVGIAHVDLKGNFIEVNPGFAEILGYSSQQLTGRNFTEITHPEDLESSLDMVQRVVKGEIANFSREKRYICQDGSTVWCQVTVSLIRDQNNVPKFCLAVVININERKKAQKERDRFFTLSLDLLCNRGFDGYFKQINPSFLTTLGHSESELLSRPLIEFVHPDDQKATLAEMEKVKSGQVINHFENRYRCKDGSYKWISWTAVPYPQEELIYAVGHDITQRKAIETEIQQTRNFLQTMIDHLPVAVFVKDGRLDKFGQMLLWNKTCEQMFGLSSSQAIGTSVYDYFPQEQADFFEQKDREAFANRLTEDIPEEPIDSLSLGRRLLHTIKIPLYDNQGQPEYLLCISEDITARKQAEQALKQSQQQLESILGSLKDVVWSIDVVNFQYLYLNEVAEDIYGHPISEFFENNNLWLEVCHPEDRELAHEASDALMLSNDSKDIEYRILRPDGEIRWIRDRAQLIYDQQGKAIRIDGIATDITYRKQIEQALKQSETDFRLIFELAPTGIAMTTVQGKLIKVNQALCQMIGYSEAELLKRSCADITHPEDVTQEVLLHQQMLSGDISEYRLEKRYITKQGRVIYGIVQVTLLRDGQGHPLNFLGQVVDITERKEAELALRESGHRLNRIIATISDGLLVVDNDGNVQFTNYAAENLFGRSAQELLDHQFGIPCVDGETTEIYIRHPQNGLMIAEMRVTQIFWNHQDAHLVSLRDITERYEAQKALKQSEEKYRQIVETAAEGIWMINTENKTTFVNQQMAEMLGYTVEEMLGTELFDFMDSDGQILARNIIESGGQGFAEKHDFKLRRKDGKDLWAIVSSTILFDKEGNYTGGLGMITDITDRKQIEQALLISEQRLEGILNSIQDVVWSVSTTTNNLIYLNPATETVYARPIEQFFQSSELWNSIVYPEDRHLIDSQIENLLTYGQSQFEYRILRPDGEVRWLYRRCRTVYDAQGNPLRFDGIDTDITERKYVTEQLRYNAYHDSLTDLPNRAFLLEQLEKALQESKINNKCFAVLFLDLDDFKVVNDSLGHIAGDQLLISIANRLQKSLTINHTLARFGGDEFAIILEIQQLQDAINAAQKIHNDLTLPYLLREQKVFINTSIGITISDPSYQHPYDLIRDADTAMYQAKAQGKGCYAVFDQNMHQKAVKRLQLETELRKAIEQRQFYLCYQPIISLQTGYLAGFEALVRWQHPEKGMISPGDFIPIAEETGLIIPLGEWVLTEACRQMQIWQQQYKERNSLKISVNLSSKQLRDPNLVSKVNTILSQTALNSRNLKLEITESMLMENVDIAMNILQQLKNLNIELSLDDFGTGYSSLSYLHRFPVTAVKIDRSFVMRMQPDNSNTEIIRAIVTLAQTLGMVVIAEGVETDLQLAQLIWLGCEYGQGFFFAKPLQSEAAENLIKEFPRFCEP